MNFLDARDYALSRLHNDLSPNLYYHNVDHTLDVCRAIDKIAEAELIVGDDLTILKTAGLFHDIGFIEQYVNNEPIAAGIAQKVLTGFNYSIEQIRIISDIILSTSIPQHPKTLMEEIMCDADLDYLGREDFYILSKRLLNEWIAYGVVNSEEEFNKKQVDFFLQHHYFTKTSRQQRESTKRIYLSELQKSVVK